MKATKKPKRRAKTTVRVELDDAGEVIAATAEHTPQLQLLGPETPPPFSKMKRSKAGDFYNRSGSRLEPYERKDGQDMVKVAFTATFDFDYVLAVHTAMLRGETRSEWLRERQKKETPGT